MVFLWIVVACSVKKGIKSSSFPLAQKTGLTFTFTYHHNWWVWPSWAWRAGVKLTCADARPEITWHMSGPSSKRNSPPDKATLLSLTCLEILSIIIRNIISVLREDTKKMNCCSQSETSHSVLYSVIVYWYRQAKCQRNHALWTGRLIRCEDFIFLKRITFPFLCVWSWLLRPQEYVNIIAS